MNWQNKIIAVTPFVCLITFSFSIISVCSSWLDSIPINTFNAILVGKKKISASVVV